MTQEIIERRVEWSSPWLQVIAKDMELGPPRGRETFYSVALSDYAAVLAVTEDGRIPLVRQFRPAIEQFSLELPSGLVEQGEDPAEAVRRELLEETGCSAGALDPLGRFHLDSGRLANTQWAYFASGVTVVHDEPTAEEELEVLFVEPRELARMIRSGEFCMVGHVGIVGAALIRGLIEL